MIIDVDKYPALDYSKVKVYLNGRIVENCTKADTVRGYVDYYTKPLVLTHGNNVLRHRVFGNVVVMLI